MDSTDGIHYSFCTTGSSSKVLEGKFDESLKNMVAATDRHSAYFALNFLDHQVCLAHLLRGLEYLTELAHKQNWSKDVADLLRKAIHERNEHPTGVIEKKTWHMTYDYC